MFFLVGGKLSHLDPPESSSVGSVSQLPRDIGTKERKKQTKNKPGMTRTRTRWVSGEVASPEVMKTEPPDRRRCRPGFRTIREPGGKKKRSGYPSSLIHVVPLRAAPLLQRLSLIGCLCRSKKGRAHSVRYASALYGYSDRELCRESRTSDVFVSTSVSLKKCFVPGAESESPPTPRGRVW